MIKNDVSRVVKYMINMVEDIMSNTKAMVVLVFDGGHLPLKEDTDSERRQHREEHLAEYKKLINVNPRDAREHLMKAFTISRQQLSEISAQISTHFLSNKLF